MAALMVVLYHFFYIPWKYPVGGDAVAIFRLFWCGVDLFFVLSGFLLTGILLDNLQSPNYFKTFYIRRAFRILPLYGVFLFVFTVVALLVINTRPNVRTFIFIGDLPLWSYWTFTQNFFMAEMNKWGAHYADVTWSLAIEEQFYLVLPFVVRLLTRQWLPIGLSLMVAGAVVARLALFSPSHGISVYVLPFCRMDALGLGGLLAWAVRSPSVFNTLRNSIALLYLLLALLLTVFIFHSIHNITIATPMMSTWGYTSIALLFTTLVALVVLQPSSPLARVSSWTPLRYMGTISYGVYLLHQPIDWLVFAFLANRAPIIKTDIDLALKVISLALTLGVAAFSWHWFEKRMLARGRRFNY